MRTLAVAVFLYGFSSCIAAEPTTIPLTEILTASGQEGMQRFQKAFEGSDGLITKRSLEKIGDASSGASDVFLVEASTAAEAIRASAGIIVRGQSAKKPVPIDEQGATEGNFWLVAYLGKSHSDPPHWIVDSVSASRNKIRFVYNEPKPGIVTADICLYYYWAPLGKLAPGTYEVELFDTDEKAVTLMRRVVVSDK